MKIFRKLSVIISILAVAALCSMPLCVFAEDAETLSGPVTNDLGITTWDCVWFGHYPQSSDGNGGFVDEPIKWRVLKVEGNDAYLLSDKNIDAMPYCAADDNPKYDCFWHESTLRSWLNGLDASTNKKQIDYTNDNFIGRAFTAEEQDAVKTMEVITDKDSDWGYHHYDCVTNDKVYLLSFDEMFSTEYGFTQDEGESVARVAVNTAYTAAGGTSGSPYMNREGVMDAWLLRTPGEYSMYADMVTDTGAYVEDKSDINSVQTACGIRPVIHLDLSRTGLWSYAGKHTARFSQTVTVASRFEKKYGDSAFSLNAKTTGDSVLVYSSSDASVASVDEKGVVTLTGAGTAVITVTAPMTDNYTEASKQVTVNVKKGERSMTCSDMSMLMTDKPSKIVVETEAGAALSYVSSDPSVAMVSADGIVTPVSAGSAEITISAEADNRYEAASASFTVTVKKAAPSIKAKKLSASFKVKKIRKKAQTFTIGASCTSGAKAVCARKSGHKYLKISKTGKVTVKKGAKKGTYSMKVLVTAAATAKYEAAAKTVTVKVKIK